MGLASGPTDGVSLRGTLTTVVQVVISGVGRGGGVVIAVKNLKLNFCNAFVISVGTTIKNPKLNLLMEFLTKKIKT